MTGQTSKYLTKAFQATTIIIAKTNNRMNNKISRFTKRFIKISKTIIINRKKINIITNKTKHKITIHIKILISKAICIKCIRVICQQLQIKTKIK